MTIIYNYHPGTGEYLSTGEARPDPMESGQYLIPAHATTEEPPAIGDNEAAVFRADDWTTVPDYRGVKYWLADGSEHEITQLGETAPEGSSSTPPPPPRKPAEEVRLAAKTQLAEASEQARLQYLTSGSAKSLVYAQKQAEAEKWQATRSAGSENSPNDFPWIKSRAERLNPAAPDYDAVATQWADKALEWRDKSLAIENAYEQAIEQIDALADDEQLEAAASAIADGIDWP